MVSQGSASTYLTYLDRVERASKDAIYRGLAFLVLFVPMVSVLLISFCVPPGDIQTGRVVLTPPCPSQSIFGRSCPTCGMTRAFVAISHGQLRQAWHFNRGSLVAYLVVVGGVLLGGAGIFRAFTDYRYLETQRRML